MNDNKNSLHLSFESENLAVPEIHVGHENTGKTAEQADAKPLVPKEIIELVSSDRFASKNTGIEVEEAAKNYARCSLHITEMHRNAAGDVAGGVLFTLADFSFTVAASRKHRYILMLTSEIRFMEKPKGNVLYSECRVIRESGKICFADVIVTDDAGTAVATVSVSGIHHS